MWIPIHKFNLLFDKPEDTQSQKDKHQVKNHFPKKIKLINMNTTISNQNGRANIIPENNFLTFRKLTFGRPAVKAKTSSLSGLPVTDDPQGQTIPLDHGNLYTRREVEELLEKSGGKISSQDIDIEKESQARDRQKRLNDIAVEKLVKKSNRILVSIRSHALPFDLFPDVMNVEEGRITIINRHFSSSVVHSVEIKDISKVFINKSIFFAQLVIISNTFEDNEVKMKNLKSKEAIFVRKVIEGLRLFVNQDIETADYSKEELLAKLEELSTTESEIRLAIKCQ